MSEPPPPPPSDLPAGLFGPRVRTDAAPSSSAPSSESTDSYSLYKYIDLRGVYGVNVGPPRADLAEAARKALKPWHRRADLSDYTESLDGPNLILNIPFSQAVKISSLLINQGSGEDASRRVRLYVNRPNGLDFDDVTDDPPSTAPATGPPSSGLPQADFLLREQDATVANAEDRIQEYPLARFAARFTSVQSVHVVLSDALAAPSRTYYLSFRGTAPQELHDKSRLLSVAAEDAASSPMGRLREHSSVASKASTGGAAADGTGGQAR